MTKTYLRDERGVAMLLELVLVAVVLTIVGGAVYQSTRHSQISSKQQPRTAAAGSPVGIANAAADISAQESTSDASLSAGADVLAGQLEDTDTDVTNLGGSSNASAY